jgi:2-methylisocitrate lyase-like PEP mutase family enzyme
MFPNRLSQRPVYNAASRRKTMDRKQQRERAGAFRRLHEGERALVLVNAWDVASARVFEEAGSPAVGTTSAGMAWSLGYADGERLPRSALIDACARISRVVNVPVTVDIERGFGASPKETCATVRALLELGVVGINIEDGREAGRLASSAALVEKIVAIRSLARELDVDLFVNARTDAYFVAWDDPDARYDEAVRRALEYVNAGADGVFVPGLEDPAEMTRMSRAITRPLNIYAGYEGIPPVDVLGRAGVRRVSLGCGPFQALLAQARTMARETLGTGTYGTMTSSMLSNSEVNALFTDR